MQNPPVRLFLTSWLVLPLLMTGAAAGPDEHGVTTEWPVDVAGAVTVEAETGTALLHPAGALDRARLQAERIVVETTWERGTMVRDGDTQLANHVTAEDRDEKMLADAELWFQTLADVAPPTFLVIAEDPARLTTRFAKGLTFVPSIDDALVQVGASPQQIRASGRASPSFWYTVEDPVAEATGGGSVVAEGTFTLFVHNVGLRAQTATGETWSDWTGYRESEPEGPATEYELRVTTIQVHNGTFTAAANEPVGLYLPALRAQVDGTVLVARVDGHLLAGDKRFVFRDDPLRLTGQGTIALSAEGSRLALAPSGSFAVNGARIVEPAPAGGESGFSPLALLGSMGGIVLVATAGSMVVGVVPAPTAGLRRIQYDRWLRSGQAAATDGDLSRAASSFRRATRIDHAGSVAWFEWAHAELAQGHGETAERLAERAGRLPGVDPLDILDLRASAAWERGDMDAFREHLGKLAAAAPQMAHGLVRDLGADPTDYDLPPVPVRQDDGGLDGYA